MTHSVFTQNFEAITHEISTRLQEVFENETYEYLLDLYGDTPHRSLSEVMLLCALVAKKTRCSKLQVMGAYRYWMFRNSSETSNRVMCDDSLSLDDALLLEELNRLHKLKAPVVASMELRVRKARDAIEDATPRRHLIINNALSLGDDPEDMEELTALVTAYMEEAFMRACGECRDAAAVYEIRLLQHLLPKVLLK